MAKRTLWPWINLAVTIATIAINGLAEALPINGLSTGEISDSYPIYFVPAGYVFSIWGVIYLALIAFSIYQVLPSQRANVHIQRIGVLYTLTGAANVAWIFLWHYERFLVTVPVILVLLGSLIAIFLKLWAGRTSLTTADRWAIYRSLQHLSWLGQRRHGGERQPVAVLSQLGGLGDQPCRLGGRDVGRGCSHCGGDEPAPRQRLVCSSLRVGVHRHRGQAERDAHGVDYCGGSGGCHPGCAGRESPASSAPLVH